MKKNPTENQSKRSVIISYGKNKRCLVSWDPDARERNLDPKIKVSCEPRLIDLISTYFPPPYNKKYLDIDLLFGTVRALLPRNPPGSAYYIEMCAVRSVRSAGLLTYFSKSIFLLVLCMSVTKR